MKNCKKTFKCDGCGKEKLLKEKTKVYNENGIEQKGIYECKTCSNP